MIHTSWLALCWTAALATFRGWFIVEAIWDRQNAKVYFYVMQGLMGVLLSLSILLFLDNRLDPIGRIVLFTLVVYVASEEALVAVCGAWFYWFSTSSDDSVMMCSKDHAWSWGILTLCLTIMAVVGLWRRR